MRFFSVSSITLKLLEFSNLPPKKWVEGLGGGGRLWERKAKRICGMWEHVLFAYFSLYKLLLVCTWRDGGHTTNMTALSRGCKPRIGCHYAWKATKSVLRSVRGTQRPFPPTNIENTFEAIQSSCRYVEMHSKRGYEFSACSDILEELEPMKRASVLFPENLRCNLTYYESENFSDSSLHHSFESGSEMWKSKLQKIVGKFSRWT